LQLRQLDLQLAFPGARVAGKDIQNELRAVDHSSLNNFFDVALLRWAKVVIEKKNIGIHRCGRSGYFFKLTRAHQSCGIVAVAALQNFANHFSAGAAG
jgi:hypothetical protein